MRYDVNNFDSLLHAVTFHERAQPREPLILVFKTPGGVAHRFIISTHGIEKQMCDRSGETLEDKVYGEG